jgi:Undecaprenyl-phosphate glucose phosphotransferase
MTATFFYRSDSFSRIFIGLTLPIQFALLLLVHYGFRTLMNAWRQEERRFIRVLIIGCDECAETTAECITREKALPCKIIGFVRLPGQKIVVGGTEVIELSDFNAWYKEGSVDDVIVAIPPSRFGDIPRITSMLERCCLPVRVRLDFGERIYMREQLFDLGGIFLLDLRATPAESLMYVVLKRSFDLAFSICAITISLPLMVLIAACVRLSSPGPIFFIQERVGLNGRIFRMYKFRTMTSADPEESDTRWTTQNDPRRTQLGAFLRSTNLDELPQFFNVLKGDMSVVGPRPERPFFVQKFLKDIQKYNARHFLKVGITGWAQVNGLRGDTSISERVEHDLYYLRNWSLAFDLRIILLTFRQFFSKDAY